MNEIIICMIKYHNIKLYINATAVGREGEGGEECDINFQVTEEEWILPDFSSFKSLLVTVLFLNGF